MRHILVALAILVATTSAHAFEQHCASPVDSDVLYERYGNDFVKVTKMYQEVIDRANQTLYDRYSTKNYCVVHVLSQNLYNYSMGRIKNMSVDKRSKTIYAKQVIKRRHINTHALPMHEYHHRLFLLRFEREIEECKRAMLPIEKRACNRVENMLEKFDYDITLIERLR